MLLYDSWHQQIYVSHEVEKIAHKKIQISSFVVLTFLDRTETEVFDLCTLTSVIYDRVK